MIAAMRAAMWVWVLALSGCWVLGGHGDDDVPFDDARDPDARTCDASSCVPVDPGPDCNPVAPPGNQGCNFGERCVWELLQTSPEVIGRIVCRPDDGPDGLGDPCTSGSVGVNDSCRGGMVCVGGQCLDVCGFDGSASAMCASGFNCTRFDGLFANSGGDPVAGACVPACDPITQAMPDGQTCGNGLGCYLLTSSSDTVAVCAGAGTTRHGEMIIGPAFANSCVPGAMPRRRDGASQDIECGGLCRPADVTSTMNAQHEGGVAPFDCAGLWGAAPPGDAAAGESCRRWYAREPFTNLTQFSNSVGWCFKHAVFQYDSNGDMMVDMPMPRCTAVTTGDVLPPLGNPPHNDAEFFWCVAKPGPFKPGPPALRLDRLPLP